MNNDKIQPKTLRISDETMNKFKDISKDMGVNQQQALAKLIEVYEIEQGKEKIPGQRANIDNFEGHVRLVTNMYLQALESAENMRALVRTEYNAELKSKDRTIMELQARLEKADKLAKEILDKEDDYKKQISEINEDLYSLQKTLYKEREEFKTVNEEQKRLYSELYDSHNKLQEAEIKTKSVLSGFMEENQNLKNQNNALMEEKLGFDKKIQEVIHEKDNLILEVEREKQKSREEIKRQEEKFEDYKKNIQTEHKLDLQVKINELQNSHRAELDIIRKELDKYKDLYYRSKQQDVLTDRNAISYSHHTGESV